MKQAAHHPSQEELEALFVNNAELDQITAYLNRFNPIRVMRMEGMEIRHSAILAWLLDPIENHGFGDAFLRAFLAQALRGAENAVLTALDVSQADLRDAEIQREKRNIDLFVSSPSNGWAFIIENKFHSKQSNGQLAKYLERAEEDAKDAKLPFKHQGIFLTLNEEAPSADVAEKYVTLRYADVCKILGALMAANQTRMGSEVQQFLNHYLEVIRDATDMNDEQTDMETLARQLYRSHKKAIDFIMEHGVSTEFTFAVDQVFGEGLDYGDKAKAEGIQVMYHWSNQSKFSFVPTAWVDALGGEESKPWTGCENWWAGFPIICWFQLNTKEDGVKGALFLYAEVGPIEDPADRRHLIESIRQCAKGKQEKQIKFGANATKSEAKFSRFLDGNSTSIADVGDAEAIEAGIRKLLQDFGAVFKAVEPVLIEFAEYVAADDD
ncbi:PDDEXK-like family protein [Celeribacter litoreus]|uniref:PDDEXK-like family protein n=1 Tax=Celeribacter litoreus TaxID=2876714 RepID=UPI001CCAE13F|nr:PD-(D/E)XK nuclease family protein [Celeribacter litoreus]MCA0045331.1 PD-(D/E)XK nuclease family protein [Celeribacter litoreus]